MPGQEWAIFRLGHRGVIESVEVDTHHFKGNYPDAIKLEGCDVERFMEDTLDTYYNWTLIMQPQKVSVIAKTHLLLLSVFIHVPLFL